MSASRLMSRVGRAGMSGDSQPDSLELAWDAVRENLLTC